MDKLPGRFDSGFTPGGWPEARENPNYNEEIKRAKEDILQFVYDRLYREWKNHNGRQICVALDEACTHFALDGQVPFDRITADRLFEDAEIAGLARITAMG